MPLVLPKVSGIARALLAVALYALATASSLRAADDTAPTPEQLEFFEKQIRPLFVEQCQSCHGREKQEAGLRLDGRETALKGSDRGPVIVPAHPN